MKLFWSSRSPFARKVTVVMHELGIADRVKLERVVVSATTTNPEVMRANPLSQLPTLILEDGTALYDSPVIVEFLDAQYGNPTLVPSDPARRWAVLRLQALGDGLVALGVLRWGEQNRGALLSSPHKAALEAKTRATLDTLEREMAPLEALSAGSIAMACGLSHLDFRFAGEGWRVGRPSLNA